MRTYSALSITFRITFIVVIAEILVTFAIEAFPNNMAIYQIAMLDAVILALLVIPPISIYVIKPFLRARADTLTQIRKMSLNDPLTGLANMHMVLEHLDRVVAGCTRHREYCAILLINLDGFKLLNEQFSYEVGNEILVEIARRLRANLRANDIIGRANGDEFVILLERLDSKADDRCNSVMLIAKKLLAVVDMPIAVKIKTVHVSASVGIRLLGGDTIDSKQAMMDADAALQQAKVAGESQVVIYDYDLAG